MGQRPDVALTGQNEKEVVYGGVDCKTRELTYTVARTKPGREFLALMLVLVARSFARKNAMVCDGGRLRTAKAVRQRLAEASD